MSDCNSTFAGLSLVVENDTAKCSTEVMADELGNEHQAVIKLVRRYLPDFEEFGQVGFEIRPGYNNSRIEYALLNEDQCYLLLTYSKNTEKARRLKIKLVKAFSEVRSASPRGGSTDLAAAMAPLLTRVDQMLASQQEQNARIFGLIDNHTRHRDGLNSLRDDHTITENRVAGIEEKQNAFEYKMRRAAREEAEAVERDRQVCDAAARVERPAVKKPKGYMSTKEFLFSKKTYTLARSRALGRLTTTYCASSSVFNLYYESYTDGSSSVNFYPIAALDVCYLDMMDAGPQASLDLQPQQD